MSDLEDALAAMRRLEMHVVRDENLEAFALILRQGGVIVGDPASCEKLRAAGLPDRIEMYPNRWCPPGTIYAMRKPDFDPIRAFTF